MNYYSGGLAELVSHPTPLTYSFFAHWFTGSASLGKAMKLLDLPSEAINQSILDLVNDQLLINLDIEEETLYSKTIFSYKAQTDLNVEPALKVNFSKAINPFCYPDTISLLMKQSKWATKPNEAVIFAQGLLEKMPQHDHLKEIAEIDKILTNEIWPTVIAIGALAEFFHRILVKDQNNTDLFWNQISAKVAKRDWFFESLASQSQVKIGKMSLAKYLELYGLRADNDYELNCPRWQEIPEFLEERLSLTRFRSESLPIVPNLGPSSETVSALIELQIMRSEARRKTLFYINKLRQAIISQSSSEETISELTRGVLLGGNIITPDSIVERKPEISSSKPSISYQGKGMPISLGNAEGVSKMISNNTTTIAQGTIGIFPNATPEFTMQYPQCLGIIFLTGGQTSHGAIVAREFGIPAILDNNAKSIPPGAKVSISGTEGSWKVI